MTTTDGRNDVDHAAGDVLFGLDVAFQAHLFLGEQRRQVLEHDLVLVVLGGQAVDLVELVQREVALAVLGDADLALDHVAGVQVEAADLARRDVDVVGGRGEARVHVAQEAETVGQHFQHAVCVHQFTALGALLDDGEHQLLLAHAAGVFDLKRIGLLEDFRHVQCLEFVEVHGIHSCGESSQKPGEGALASGWRTGAVERGWACVWPADGRIMTGNNTGV